MCYDCLLSGADSRYINISHSLGEINLRAISPDLLVAPDFERFTKDKVLTDGVLDVYLHRPSGPVQVNGGSYGVQTIQALQLDENFITFFEDALRRLDSEIDLDLRFVDSVDQADIRLFSDSEIDLGGGDITLGIALGNETSEKSFWELMLNTPAFEGDVDYLYYAALHELGHALGLEHPFDNSDGEVFESSDSLLSAYPEETVMAYRQPLQGDWPIWYSANDLDALKLVWGEEVVSTSTLLPQKLIGTIGDDQLVGGSGSDSLRGEFGNDQLIGGVGGDEMWGGPGSNQFTSPADGQRDLLLITRDGSASVKRNRRTVDEIAELGIEDQVGILDAQTGKLRFQAIAMQSNSYGQLKGVGIFVGNRLEAVYTGGNLSVLDLRNLTVGLPANFGGDLG